MIDHSVRVLGQALEKNNGLLRLKGAEAGDGTAVEEMIDPSSVSPELLTA